MSREFPFLCVPCPAPLLSPLCALLFLSCGHITSPHVSYLLLSPLFCVPTPTFLCLLLYVPISPFLCVPYPAPLPSPIYVYMCSTLPFSHLLPCPPLPSSVCPTLPLLHVGVSYLTPLPLFYMYVCPTLPLSSFLCGLGTHT